MKLRAVLHVLAVGGVLLGAGLGSGLALAQQQAPMSPRMQALVREYIEVTNAAKMFDDIITASVPAMMNQLRQRAQIPGDLIDEMSNAMIAEFRATQGEMIELLSGVIGRALSEEDLAGVIAFYRTPTGRNLLAATPRMAQEILPLAQRWGQEAAQRAMQRAIGKARERGIQL